MRSLNGPILRAGSRMLREKSGSAALLGALMMTVFLWCGAFAVDLGSLYFERRTAQGAVDLAAIAAAQDIASAEAAARATLEANDIRYVTSLVVTPGRYTADPALAPEARFVANAEPFNAVQVALQQEAPLYLARAVAGVDSMTLETRAIAATTEQAAFSIGSRLARLEGGIANALLEALLGSQIALTAMNYRALADADIKLFDFMDALASELDMTGASYDELLDAGASIGQVASAMAEVASGSGQSDAAAALLSLASAAGALGITAPLAALLDLGPYGELRTGSPAPGFDVSLNVLGLLSGAFAAAGGNRQVSLDLGAAVPGLVDLEVELAVGEQAQESAWVSVGERGATVRTAQTRLSMVATVGGFAGAIPIFVRIPLYAEIAPAEARLDAISCGPDPRSDASVDVAARPGIAELWIGEMDTPLDDFSEPAHLDDARLLTTPLARVKGRAHAAMTSPGETILHFDRSDIDAQRPKSTATQDPLTALLGSLMRDLDLEVESGSLSHSLAGILQNMVASIATAAAPALDKALGGILETLGVSIGEADVTVRGVRCDGAALVG